MNIQADKIALAKMLLETENPKIIASIKKIFSTEKTHDFLEELSVEQIKEIEKASFEIDRGETTDYEEFMQKHR